MYPTLYHAFKDLFGLDILILKVVMTYGFFMFVAFLCAYFTTRSELVRREKSGQINSFYRKVKIPGKCIHYVLSIILGFIIAWKLSYFVIHFKEVIDTPQDFFISLKGNIAWGIFGALLMTGINYLELKRKENNINSIPIEIHPYEMMPNLVIVAAFFGLLGANLFAHLENIEELILNPGVFFQNPLSGGSFLGALIGGAIGVLWFIRKSNISWKIMGDITAPGLLLAYGIGRMGCHLSGDGDWGIDNLSRKPDMLAFLPDWVWSFDYPGNVHGIVLDNPVWPTPLYESVACIILFFVLWKIRTRISYEGMLFSIYLIFVGIERLLIEQIRINPEYLIMNLRLTQAEMISSVLLLMGIIGLFYFPQEQKEKPI